MDLNSSPLPVRRACVIPSTPSLDHPSRRDFASDEQDEALRENVPNSSPYFTQPTQIVTQTTQLVSRTSLKPAASSTISSPRSTVEVPASSPFQPRRAPLLGGRLASAMAPAGTMFRAPTVPAKLTSRKRELMYISSSEDEMDDHVIAINDSSDESPARGDIRPASFKRPQQKPQNGSLNVT